jgi:hypothetical protein
MLPWLPLSAFTRLERRIDGFDCHHAMRMIRESPGVTHRAGRHFASGRLGCVVLAALLTVLAGIAFWVTTSALSGRPGHQRPTRTVTSIRARSVTHLLKPICHGSVEYDSAPHDTRLTTRRSTRVVDPGCLTSVDPGPGVPSIRHDRRDRGPQPTPPPVGAVRSSGRARVAADPGIGMLQLLPGGRDEVAGERPQSRSLPRLNRSSYQLLLISPSTEGAGCGCESRRAGFAG